MGNPEEMQVATYISHLPKDSERRQITTSDKLWPVINVIFAQDICIVNASTRRWEKRGTGTNLPIKYYFSLCRVE